MGSDEIVGPRVQKGLERPQTKNKEQNGRRSSLILNSGAQSLPSAHSECFCPWHPLTGALTGRSRSARRHVTASSLLLVGLSFSVI